MKTKSINVDGDIELKGKFFISCKTNNGYVVELPEDFEPNFFQRLLYKILGFKVTKQ